MKSLGVISSSSLVIDAEKGITSSSSAFIIICLVMIMLNDETTCWSSRFRFLNLREEGQLVIGVDAMVGESFTVIKGTSGMRLNVIGEGHILHHGNGKAILLLLLLWFSSILAPSLFGEVYQRLIRRVMIPFMVEVKIIDVFVLLAAWRNVHNEMISGATTDLSQCRCALAFSETCLQTQTILIWLPQTIESTSSPISFIWVRDQEGKVTIMDATNLRLKILLYVLTRGLSR